MENIDPPRPLTVMWDAKSGSYRGTLDFWVLFGYLESKTIPREVGNHMLEYTARTNLKLVLTRRQLEILLGCLLGDAYISSRGQIQIEQSIKQLQYLNWKYRELKSVSYGPPREIKRFHQKNRKIYIGARFWLRQYFRPLRVIFYPNGKKIVPREIFNYFSDLSLAVWYMDDGNLYKSRHLKIATDGFDEKSRTILQELLLNKFNIESTIHKNGKLRIAAKSLPRFFKLVKPHIHSSMRYKIP